MLSESNFAPSYWFESSRKNEHYVWPAALPVKFEPREGVHVVLGDVARRDKKSFEKSCDLFAYFLTYYALALVDREVRETEEELIWSGRFAGGRRGKPRFFELGGGGSARSGAGGWDFHEFTMTCDRTTGELALEVEPIEIPVTQRSAAELESEWRIEELKLMGWKPLKGIDFFGDQLLPPEYSAGIEFFKQGKEKEARELGVVSLRR